MSTPAASLLLHHGLDAGDLAVLAPVLASGGWRCSRLPMGPVAPTTESLAAADAVLLGGAGVLQDLLALRARSSVPMLGLLRGGGAVDRVLLLEAGADDAVALPCEPREVLARLRALCRRARPSGGARSPRCVRFGRWQLDRQTRVLSAPTGLRVELSRAELQLLDTFLERPGTVLGRDELMDLARGRAIQAYERSIDLLVSRLRAKLNDDPREPRYIRTVRGVGYLFDLLGVDAQDPSAEAGAPMFRPRYQVDKGA